MNEILTDKNLLNQVPSKKTLEIKPSKGWASLGLMDIWEYKELVYFLMRREIHGMYRQTALGTSWLLLRPLINMILLTFVFGGLMNVTSEGVPYPVFSLAALLPWGYFAGAVTRSSGSLVQNINVISKVYFPRMIIPLASTLSGLIEIVASFSIFFVMMFYYKLPLRIEMLWLPVFLFMAILFALAFGLWLATLSVKYRDISFGVTFIIQGLMYLSPVIYSASIVPERFQLFYHLNPMTGVINGFRWALLGIGDAPGQVFFISFLLLILVLVAGAYVFRRTERTIADIM